MDRTAPQPGTHPKAIGSDSGASLVVMVAVELHVLARSCCLRQYSSGHGGRAKAESPRTFSANARSAPLTTASK
eukprot:3654107-Alexandrium_andersonii.AAC.1